MEGQQKDHARQADQSAQNDALHLALAIIPEVQNTAAELEQREVGQNRQEVPRHGLRTRRVEGTQAVGPDMDIRVGVAENHEEHPISKEEQRQSQDGGFQDMAEAEPLSVRGSKAVGLRGSAKLFAHGKVIDQQIYKQRTSREQHPYHISVGGSAQLE